MTIKIPGNIVKISDTQFTFTPSSNLLNNTKYKMVVKSNFRAEDGLELGNNFNSIFTTVNKSITLTYPNGNLLGGQNIDITWINVNLSGETVRVEFYDGSSWNIIGNLIPVEIGLLNWDVPVILGVDRQIKLISSDGFESSIIFEIYDDRQLIITSPNGSEIYTLGQIDITWDSISILGTENVKLMLYKNDIYDSDIIASTLNTGSYLWEYTTNPGIDYKIKIELISDNNINDLSNADFAIENIVENLSLKVNTGFINRQTENLSLKVNTGFINRQTENLAIKVNTSMIKTLTITYPNGGESVSIDSDIDITWTSNINSSENIKIDLYKNNVYSSVISASTVNDGSFTWDTTGLTADTDYKIYIELLSDSGVNDLSNADFELEVGSTIPMDYIASWKLDDNLATTNVIDETGVHNATCTVNTNTIYNPSGKIGGCQYKTTNVNTEIPDSADLKVQEFSISLWVKFDNVSGEQGLFNGTDGNYWDNGYGITLKDGRIQGHKNREAEGANRAISTTVPIVGTWYHVVFIVVNTPTPNNIYINGILEGSSSNITPISHANEVKRIGNSGNGKWLDGYIDQVRFYDRVLTSTEVTELYNET